MAIIGRFKKEGKGVDKDVFDRPRIIIFFDIYFRKFWSLILINLLYLLAIIPIITIGPATAGITKILRNYAREEHAFIWGDFRETFVKNFRQAMVVGLIDIVAFVLISFNTLFYWQTASPGLPIILSLVVMLLTATILLFMNYYIFTMLVTFKLSFKQLIKNAFIFALIGLPRNVLITALIGLLVAAIIFFFSSLAPVVLLFVIFLLFSTCGLIISFITYPLIKKYMIDNVDPQTGKPLEVKDLSEADGAEEDYRTDELDGDGTL